MTSTTYKKLIRRAEEAQREAARELQLEDDLKAIKLSNLKEINIYDPTPELLEYIKKSENLIAYYAPKFLIQDLSKDKDYPNLPLLDQHLILVFAIASLSVDVYEVLHREKSKKK